MFSELKLSINFENAAFSDGLIGHEIARILRKYADSIEEVSERYGDLETRLFDINGNKVGVAQLDY